MTDHKIHAFALTLTAEVLRAQHPEAELGQLNVALYDQKTDQEAYSLYFDQIEDEFVLCRVLKSEKAAELSGQLADFFYNSELEIIATFNTSEEAASELIEIALEEDLRPQINYMFHTEP